MKNALRIGWSLAISAGILWLVFREAGSPAPEVVSALGGLSAGAWAAYALAQLAQGWLRAVRYRLLLAGAGATPLPAPGRMFGVTLARNMFVDMLPARTGELMYWALLNRGEGVRHQDCVSSMTLSVLFDFLALAAVLALAVGAPLLEAGGRLVLVWGAGVLAVAVALGGLALFQGPHLAARLTRMMPAGIRGWRWVAGLEVSMTRLAESFEQVRAAGVLWRAAGLSVVIRIVKYAGLLVAFYGVARELRPALAALPVWQTLIGLIGGEGGAALPVPTFLSLGSYEAAATGALRLTGVPGADAAIVLLGTHVASQVVDYALGGLGLLALLWGVRRAGALAAAGDARAGKTNAMLVAGLFMLAILAAVGGVWYFQMAEKRGAVTAPGAGTVLPVGPHELAALEGAWGDRSGFVIWSSTMYGQHDLVKMAWPSGDMTRLTKNPAVDSMPKISPDGKRVVFARSRQEWVSFRNWEEWDIWMLDLKTRKATQLAEHGTEPGWTGDGQAVVFQRGGREVVQVNIETKAETILLGPKERRSWTGPSLDSAGERLAVTVRGKQRSTSLFSLPEGQETRVAGGCQLAFVPGGKWLVLIEDGGAMKNRICRVDRQGRHLETLLDMPGAWSHEYFPRVSNDGSLLVFGAAREGHEHDTADYEIFLWRIGAAPAAAARLSFHTGNDQWPDVWVEPPPPPKPPKSQKHKQKSK